MYCVHSIHSYRCYDVLVRVYVVLCVCTHMCVRVYRAQAGRHIHIFSYMLIQNEVHDHMCRRTQTSIQAYIEKTLYACVHIHTYT